MKRVAKKLQSRRGETLVGILIAVLIIALASGLFAAMYSASMHIDLTAREQDELFYDAVEELEEMIDSGAGESTGSSVHYQPVNKNGNSETSGSGSNENVDLFTRDGMTAYNKKAGGGTTP